jgi:hypothetical protein
MIGHRILEFIRSIRDAVCHAIPGSELLIFGDKLVGPVVAVPNLRDCIKQPHNCSSFLDQSALSEITVKQPKVAQLTRGRA